MAMDARVKGIAVLILAHVVDFVWLRDSSWIGSTQLHAPMDTVATGLVELPSGAS